MNSSASLNFSSLGPGASASRGGVLLLALCLFLLGSGRLAAERGPFGLEKKAFEDLVARNDKRAFLALETSALKDPGPIGPPAWFFAAFWLEHEGFDGKPEELLSWTRVLVELYDLSAGADRGYLRDRALGRLPLILAGAARGARAESPERQALWEASLGLPPPRKGRSAEAATARLEGLLELGRAAEVLSEAAELLRTDLGVSGTDRGAALYYQALAARDLGQPDWVAALASLLSGPTGPWLDKGIALALGEGPRAAPGGKTGATQAPSATGGAAAPPPPPPVDPLLLATARLRSAVAAKDYAAGYRLSKAALPALKAEPGRELTAVFAKAYLFSGMSREGLGLMDELGAAQGAASPSSSVAWTAAFYKARMLKAVEAPEKARALFEGLLAGSIDRRDRDSVIWYRLESAFAALEKGAGPLKDWASPALRSAALAAGKLALLAAASKEWGEGSSFRDLASPLLMQALVDRDWRSVDGFAALLAGRLGTELGARSLYLAGRARELGLVDPDSPPPRAKPEPKVRDEAGPARLSDGSLAATSYAAVLALPGVSDYYRLVAASRLGLDLLPWKGPATGPAPKKLEGGEGPEARLLVDRLIAFGMASLSWDFAKEEAPSWDDESLRSLASATAKAGRPYDSMRFANLLVARSERPARQDFERLYPRPWLDEIRSSTRDSSLPEALVLGLLRSESWFDPGVSSHAGAVGLAQLMPATAREIAQSLRLVDYDLKRPGDSIRLGMTMFRDLMRENHGQALRAMFAYNAGRGRLKRWVADSGGLPDDLFLESLSIEETRQYGRNIVTATSWYGALYYGRGTAASVRELFRGVDGFS